MMFEGSYTSSLTKAQPDPLQGVSSPNPSNAAVDAVDRILENEIITPNDEGISSDLQSSEQADPDNHRIHLSNSSNISPLSPTCEQMKRDDRDDNERNQS